jgi:DNA-binding NarL/FixJ family response regulator
MSVILGTHRRRSTKQTLMPITVLLADDAQMVREAVARILTSDAEIQLVGQATGFRHAIQVTNALRPQVIVMDMHMDDEHLVTDAEFRSCLADSKLIAISIWNDRETKEMADSYGAVRFLDKSNLAIELVPVIKELIRGRTASCN